MNTRTLVLILLLALCGTGFAAITGWRCEVIDSVEQERSWTDGSGMNSVTYRVRQGFSGPIINSMGVIGASQKYSHTGSNWLGSWSLQAREQITLYGSQRSVVASESASGVFLSGKVHKITSDGRVLAGFGSYLPDSDYPGTSWHYWQTSHGRVPVNVPWIHKATFSGLIAGSETVQQYSTRPFIVDARGQRLWQGDAEDSILDMNGHGEAIVSLFMDGTYTWYPGIGLVRTAPNAVKIDNNGSILYRQSSRTYYFQNSLGIHHITVPTDAHPTELNDNGAISFIDSDRRMRYWYDGAELHDLRAKVTECPGVTSYGIADMNEYGFGVGVGTRDGDAVLLKYSPVPEPGSLAALGLGAAFLFRKRSATRK